MAKITRRSKQTPTSYLLAIDPGEAHCGMALMRRDGTSGEAEKDWACIAAWTVDPDECIRYTASALMVGVHRTEQDEQRAERHGSDALPIDTLVIEEFRLYPWASEEQAFSEIPTIKVIGVLEYLHRAHNRLGGACTLVKQSAQIKKPTRAICRARKVISKAGSTHAKDAQLHAWYHLLRLGETEAI